MKFRTLKHRIGTLAAAVVLTTILPVSAAVAIVNSPEPTAVMTFSKSGSITNQISFSTDDFRVVGNKNTSLDSIVLTSLPVRDAGYLMLGDEMLVSGDVIAFSALNGIRFCPLSAPRINNTSFSFIPVFTSGESGRETEVHLYLLDEDNTAPTAENMEFTTYKNVAYTGRFSYVDPEGDLVTFQIVDKPARGSISFSETNDAEFTYTPYENKTGKDSFTYVAIDAVGNTSKEATVKIQIEKPSTKVTYADMVGHPAYNAAIRLAEDEIYVGSSINGTHYFQPNIPLTRVEFLVMAMEALNADLLEGVTTTGFYDDDVIQTWAKPYVASALKSGSVQGRLSADGQIIFYGNDTITHTEAAVFLDRMLSVSDVSVETWGGNASLIPSWACQAVMNLESAGVLNTTAKEGTQLSNTVTRADAALMLSSALDLLEARKDSNPLFQW